MKVSHFKSAAKKGFSLVEVLAAVGIIGIIAFLAIPNIVAIKEDSERNLAISKAEAVNMAIASYIGAKGRDTAVADYAAATTENMRYRELTPYLSFAPTNLSDYKPNGFALDLPNDLTNLSKTVLKYENADGTAGSTIAY
ncbi:type II secretion system GspH family protein [Verrucomicrobiales bacterium]|nr:type II secretion system GspH family protein [bacterium]MDB4662121.1 type II secretion system GspH family protein [Verrucomicrobiales bacterium]MDC0276223.1 type II secretion system GspH family protein [Verrucomicrobiales bacterium]MDC0312105.1 type II secretion system GspH family protein [bacterium]MDC0321791.1 type II secretion system GspH family protein [Verrucomicrobiales bacterium]